MLLFGGFGARKERIWTLGERNRRKKENIICTMGCREKKER